MFNTQKFSYIMEKFTSNNFREGKNKVHVKSKEFNNICKYR